MATHGWIFTFTKEDVIHVQTLLTEVSATTRLLYYPSSACSISIANTHRELLCKKLTDANITYRCMPANSAWQTKE